MGWLEAVGSIFSWLGGEGFGAALARIAIGLGISKLLQNNQDNAAGSSSSSTPRGSRQQISPATDNKTPVAYGDSYFAGTITDVQLTNANKEMFAVLTLCEKTGDIYSTNPSTPASRTMSSITIDDIYISNQKVTFMADGTTVDYTTDDTGVQDTNLHNLVGIYLYQGDSNSPMLPCVTGTTTPIAGTVPPAAYSYLPGWDNTYTMENYIFAVVKMNYDPSKGAHTIPQIKFHVRNTMNKPGDVLIDYATNEMYGAGLTEAAVDLSTIAALNSYSDESVTYGTNPAQPRYRINGLIRTTEAVLTNMEKIAATAGSNISYDVSTGKWAVLMNKPTSKTLDFNDSNIIGQINLTSSNLDSYYNQIEVQFPYAVLKDQFNYVRVNLPDADLNQNETPNMYQLTHELTNNLVQASVLANLDLRQSREDLLVTFNTDYSKYNVQIGDVFGLTNSVYGWSSKLFKVIRVKKTESDAGQLTVEITGLSYNADVFTVSDISTFIPSTGVGHSLPSLSPIATPAAPGVDTTTISSQPSISITGVVPTGVVTEMEFWYTKDADPVDNNRKYTMLGTMRAENSGPYTIGATPVFKTVLLSSGTYYFKVRAANASGSSKFSPPSAATPYTYTQVPNLIPYQTPVTDSTGAVVGGMSLGLMAAYLASKLNWFGSGGILSGNADIMSVFGLSSNTAKAITDSVKADGPQANITPGFSTVKSEGNVAATNSNGSTINFKAGPGMDTGDGYLKIILGADPGTNTIIIDAQEIKANTTPNVTPITNTVTLNGQVFPCLFGPTANEGSGSRAGIFTHDYLVFSGATHSQMRSTNIINHAANLTASVRGHIQNFYTFPTVSSFSQKPYYDESKTDKFDANTQISAYYATATYTGGNLDAQSWSVWHRINENNGVSGFNGTVNTVVPAVYANVVVNPIPGGSTISDADYRVEDPRPCNGSGNTSVTSTWAAGETDPFSGFDPFKPTSTKVVLVTPEHTVSTTSNNKAKVLDVATGTVGNTIPFGGGSTELIIFGVSVYNNPNATPFSNNTVFGHVGPHFINTYRDAIAIRQICNNGSRFVAINSANDFVYWSDDGKDWTRVKLNTAVTTDPDWDPTPAFKFVGWDGSKFLAYNMGKRVATSTEGKIWVEHIGTTGLADLTSQVCVTDGHYLAVSPDGVQSSTDGITWDAVVLPLAFNGTGPSCVIWDGSKYIIGNRYSNQGGAALLTSTDGISWSPISMLSNPNSSTQGDATDVAATTYAVNINSGIQEFEMP